MANRRPLEVRSIGEWAVATKVGLDLSSSAWPAIWCASNLVQINFRLSRIYVDSETDQSLDSPKGENAWTSLLWLQGIYIWVWSWWLELRLLLQGALNVNTLYAWCPPACERKVLGVTGDCKRRRTAQIQPSAWLDASHGHGMYFLALNRKSIDRHKIYSLTVVRCVRNYNHDANIPHTGLTQKGGQCEIVTNRS